jgi:hypothetical protein
MQRKTMSKGIHKIPPVDINISQFNLVKTFINLFIYYLLLGTPPIYA